MAKNNTKPPRIAPLQRVVAEEITDPAERARLDELVRRARKAPVFTLSEDALSPTAVRILDQSQRQSSEERIALLARLSNELSPARQLDVLALVLAHLSPDTLESVHEEMTSTSGARNTGASHVLVP